MGPDTGCVVEPKPDGSVDGDSVGGVSVGNLVGDASGVSVSEGASSSVGPSVGPSVGYDVEGLPVEGPPLGWPLATVGPKVVGLTVGVPVG